MPSTRSEALAVLGLAGSSDPDAAAVQRAFERLARRYPEPHFPERFRALLEARDTLLDSGRRWREALESPTLDLSWALPHLGEGGPAGRDLRTLLQDMLRAGYVAEPLELPGDELFEDIPF